jgi:hypothetical protein
MANKTDVEAPSTREDPELGTYDGIIKMMQTQVAALHDEVCMVDDVLGTLARKTRGDESSVIQALGRRTQDLIVAMETMLSTLKLVEEHPENVLSRTLSLERYQPRRPSLKKTIAVSVGGILLGFTVGAAVWMVGLRSGSRAGYSIAVDDFARAGVVRVTRKNGEVVRIEPVGRSTAN